MAGMRESLSSLSMQSQVRDMQALLQSTHGRTLAGAGDDCAAIYVEGYRWQALQGMMWQAGEQRLTPVLCAAC